VKLDPVIHYFANLDALPIWEKVFVAAAGFAVLRLAWWLIEVATDESKPKTIRVWSCVGFFGFVIAVVVVLTLVADALTRH